MNQKTMNKSEPCRLQSIDTTTPWGKLFSSTTPELGAETEIVNH